MSLFFNPFENMAWLVVAVLRNEDSGTHRFTGIGTMVDKQKAFEILQRQIDFVETLKHKERFSPDFKKWQRDTEVAIEKIFGENGRHLGDFRRIGYALNWPDISESDHILEYQQGLDDARKIIESMVDEITEYGTGDNDQSSTDSIAVIENVCERFHLVVRQLRERHDSRETLSVEDEYDVQDLLHSLLTLHFDDIRPEECTPSYAGSSSRVDFLLKQEQIVIEVKKTRKGLAAKQIGEQLIVDIARYKDHPDCKKLLCFVYDPEGRIANPRGIENDLNRDDGDLPVKVIITPRHA